MSDYSVLFNPKKSIMLIMAVSLLATGLVTIRPAQATGAVVGPHTDSLQINESADPNAEFLKLKAGGIDLMDTPLTQPQIDDVLGTGSDVDGPETSIALLNFKESAMFLLDLNNRCEAGPFFQNATGRWCGTISANLTPAAGYEGAVRRVPDTAQYPQGTFTPLSKWTGSVQFRRALATLRNGVISSIVTTVGTAIQLNSPVPAAFAGDSSSDLLNPADNILRWTGGRTQANTILEGLGLHCSDWRTTTLTCGKAGTPVYRSDPSDTRCGATMCSLIFYARSDDPRRLTMGQLFQNELTAVGIPVDFRAVDRSVTSTEVLTELEYNIYTGGWIQLFDKDYIYDLYTDTTILPAGSISLDYVLNTDATYKSLAAGPKFGSPTPGDTSGVNDAFKNTLKRHAEIVVNLPMYGNTATAAFRKPYWVGTNQRNPSALRGVINAAGYGPNNFFTILNAYRPDTPNAPYGGSFHWGFKTTLQDPNPVTSAWLWDGYLLSTIYDTLLVRDPYSLPTFRPWLSEPFNVTTWSGTTPHGAPGAGSLVRLNIQPGPDGQLNTFDDIRFHPHPQITLPGPDNAYGTSDDVVVPGTGPDGKLLDGFDIEASLLYPRDHIGFNYGLVSNIVDVVVSDRPDVPGADNLHVDVYYGVVSYLVKNWVGSMNIIPSDIWSLRGTPGVPGDDPIPNPYQFNTRDPNNDGNRADNVLRGTGAWLYNTQFDLNQGGVLAANRFYFTGARTPVDLDVTGNLDASAGSEPILSSGADDALTAVAQFQFALPYTPQRDINYDKKTDIDDYLAVLVYFQGGSVTLSDGVTYGGTSDAVLFRSWPSAGPG